MPTQPRTHHFTLIELLVVVSIIAILASLLLPALSQARWQVKMTVCQSNLKSMGGSIMLYADDNDEIVPPYCADIYNAAQAGATAKSHLDYLWAKLTPYGLNGRQAQCPVGRGPSWKSYWMKTYSSRSDYFYILVSGSYYKLSSYLPLRLSGKTDSAATTIVTDTADDPWGTGYWANVHKRESTSPAISQSKLYLDGHVKLALPPNISKRFGLGY